MSLTIDLGPDLEARLRTEANRQGTPVEALLQELLTQTVRQEQPEGRQETGQSQETPEPPPGSRQEASRILLRLDRLALEFAVSLSPPDEALRREYFYGERG